MLLLFVATLVDSFLAPKGASPGHAGAFWLAWVFSTRLFLVKPSVNLALFSVFLVVSCVSSNHGIVSNSLLRSPYFYFASGSLVLWWEKVVCLVRQGRDLDE